MTNTPKQGRRAPAPTKRPVTARPANARPVAKRPVTARPMTKRASPVRPASATAATVVPTQTNSPEEMLGLYRPDLAALLAGSEAPSFRYAQVFEHLMRPHMPPFSESTVLPNDIRPRLDGAGICSLKIEANRASTDGTTKLLLAAHDGAHVETVLMPYNRRTTVCISSQAGCPVGCAFCATGAAGFRRNLSVSEITDQVRIATSLLSEGDGRVSNVVYMGMGEPLLNLQNVLSSIRVLTDSRGLHLGHRSISVSTVGIPAGMLRLARTEPQVNLALSLHASSDGTREMLIPHRYRHSLSDVLAAAWEHFALTRRKLMVEYVMLRGVNDSPEDARRLAALLRGHVVTVNLLSWNPVATAGAGSQGAEPTPGAPKGRRAAFQPSPMGAVATFRDILLESRLEVTVRRSRGADIEAACGQLAGRQASYEEAEVD